jgi:aspartyl-tRNA(Asn)/glutamyl-tRNA(Gln) amidotransferase subunit A
MLTITAAADAVREGRTTPSALLEECLGRIDRHEEQVRAWVLVDRERARQEARQRTAEQQAGRIRGPLHGIPIGVKDVIDVFDWPTACGSELWKNSVARQDAEAVTRLRAAGAVLVGKTVTTAYASFDPPPTRNPWDLKRTPGGSSSGSAAAVACGMCLGALATQTGGSTTRPAAYCGVASLKPTHGAIAVGGVLPLAPSLDHIGIIAGAVGDLGHIWSAVADVGVEVARQERPVRFGRLGGMFVEQAEPAVRAMMDAVQWRLQQRGATVVDVRPPAGFVEVSARQRTVMAVEAAMYHEGRLRRHPEDYGPCVRQLLEEGLACPAAEYARCKEHQREMTWAIQAMFENVDVLLTPSATGPAPGAETTGDPAFNSPWSYTGSPTVSLTTEWTAEGLPIGIQLIAGRGQEAALLKAAGWCEEQLNVPRREPAVVSS